MQRLLASAAIVAAVSLSPLLALSAAAITPGTGSSCRSGACCSSA